MLNKIVAIIAGLGSITEFEQTAIVRNQIAVIVATIVPWHSGISVNNYFPQPAVNNTDLITTYLCISVNIVSCVYINAS